MQKLIKSRLLYLVLGVVTTIGITSVFAYSIFAPDIGFTPRAESWNVDNTSDAINDLYETCDYCKTRFDGLSWFFTYEGKEHKFDVPLTGNYLLEVWGAQGGNAGGGYLGGYGAYSTGVAELNQSQKLYVYVGGQGAVSATGTATGGYNGGGSGFGSTDCCSGCGYRYAAGGGGATHIATVSGILSSLSSYKDTGGTNLSNEILIVAGGGGGSYYDNDESAHTGGAGGGISGRNGIFGFTTYSYKVMATSGTQTSGGTAGYTYASVSGNGSFGKGQDIGRKCQESSGGGGGYYGGGGGAWASGAGGSGYINSPNLKSTGSITKHMVCNNCPISSDDSTNTTSTANVSSDPISDYTKSGNGYAMITYLG